MILVYYFVGIIICLCLTQIFYFLWSRRRLFYLATKFSGPPALPIIGNGLSFFCKQHEILKVILKLTNPYPSPLRLWLGPKLLIFVKDPDHFHRILTSTKMSRKDNVYSFLEPFLGKGLFTSSGTIHKAHRKILQPMFSPKVLEGYSYLFQKHARNFIENIKSNVDGPDFDILLYLHDSAFISTMDILLEDSDDHSIDYKIIPSYIRRFYQIFINRVTKFWLHSDLIFGMTNLYKEQEYMKKIAMTLTEEIANARVPEIVEKLEKNEKTGEIDLSRSPSMLEMIIDMKIKDADCLSNDEIIDHLITFVATSQDTQSSAMAFTLMMFGMYPKIQDKVVAELKEVLGDVTRQIEFSDLSKFKYMDMCIKESMRLFAVGPFILRKTQNEFELDDKYTIPAGCTVVLGIFNVHRSPEHWEKPEEFYPEHFLPEAVEKRHPYAFVPFSAGPRRCIAQHYSYTNMKILIGSILQNYVIEADGKVSDIELMSDISIRPINGHLIRIKKRVF